LFVILSEAKNLSSIETAERFFASLRMTKKDSPQRIEEHGRQ